MQIRFVHQVLVGTRVYGAGETANLEDAQVRQDLIGRGIAVEYVETPKPSIREAVSNTAATARKAVSR